MTGLQIELPAELVEAIAERAAELVREQPERLLTPKELAAHLGCSVRAILNWQRPGCRT
jgi:hypothetical protein